LLLDACCSLYYTRKSDRRKDTQHRVEERAQAKRELLQAIKNIISRLSGRVILLSGVLCVLTLIEMASAALGRRTPLLAALHPANALLMAGLTVLLLIQGWHLMRERRREMKPSEGKPPRTVAERTR
jgi:hypothetical protein